jgi:uncharacterized protein YcbX
MSDSFAIRDVESLAQQVWANNLDHSCANSITKQVYLGYLDLRVQLLEVNDSWSLDVIVVFEI